MKRYGNLYDTVISLDNLDLAERRVRRGKKTRRDVVRFLSDREQNLQRLHQSLLDGTFRTSEYNVFEICDPKRRTIYSLPYCPDRIVQHAIMNVCEPVFTRSFIAGTYASISGRGIHLCVKHLKHALRTDPDGTRYCLKIDISKYYPSIDHETMKAEVRRKIKDKRLLLLIDGIVDSAPGLPIGNLLSQVLANVYLSRLDHYAKEQLHVRRYYRYVDDIVVLAGSKKQLHGWLIKIRRCLEDLLHLQVKGNWQIFPVESRGIDFLGYVFRHDYTLVRKSIKARMLRRARRGQITTQSLASYRGWLKWCNGKNLYKKLIHTMATSLINKLKKWKRRQKS